MEEDIKILERFMKRVYEEYTPLKTYNPEAKAIENLIAGYKNLEEKNKDLTWYFENQKDNYIPKSKVKEKIEELEAMSISKDIYYDDIKRLLQELLES